MQTRSFSRIQGVALVLALVIYGSLFPFDYQPHSPAWSDWMHLMQPAFERMPKGDVVGNVLLFVPYGLLLAFAPTAGTPWRGLFLGAALALGVQYLQFWFPDRDPNGVDALLNVVGMLLGWMGACAGQPLLRRVTRRTYERPRFVVIASALMLVWLLYRWFPWVPTLDFQNVKNGLKPLMHWGAIDWVDVLRNFAGWLVFLRLARYSALQHLRYSSLAMLCVLVVAVEPVFLQNTVSPANVMGLVLALNFGALMYRGPASLAAVALILAAAIGVAALVPFHLGSGRSFLWIPLAGSLGSNPLANIPPLIEKLYLYGSLVFLLRYLGVSFRATCWGVCLYLLTLEWVQQWLPGRTPEITDPLLAFGLAYVMRPWFEHSARVARAGSTETDFR